MKALPKIVDELGLLKAEIADLTEKRADLEQILKDSGKDAIDGKIYRATISRFSQLKVAWQKIAVKLEASRQIIKANSSRTDVVRVNTNTRIAA
jgi:hypothetical protein